MRLISHTPIEIAPLESMWAIPCSNQIECVMASALLPIVFGLVHFMIHLYFENSVYNGVFMQLLLTIIISYVAAIAFGAIDHYNWTN